MKQFNITKDFLYKEYIIKQKSMKQIAKEIGCHFSTVYICLNKYNISLVKYKCSKILTKKFLYKEYITNKKSALEIAKEIGYAKVTVLKYLKIYNIKPRTISEAKRGKHSSSKTEFKKGMVPWNKGLTKETDNRVKNNALKTSKARKLLNLKGKNNPRYGKKAAHGKGSHYKQSYMRSTWELAYAKHCIKNHIKYRYEPKAFEIVYKYNSKKKEGTYRLNFYLLETNEYIEVKGYWRDDAKVKFNAFKRQYKDIKIKVLKHKELKKKGIIK